MKKLLRNGALVVLLGLASASQLLAATYFVNSNGGNDSYNGAAPAWTSGSNGPWQTLAKLAAVTLAPNDTVYLACGGVWNETLKVPSSGASNVPITITGGPGYCATPPLIDGAVTIPAHQWVQHSGSIYKAKLPIDLIANPNPGVSLSGWTQWSATGDAGMATDSACAGQIAPCMAFTSGTSNSVVSSNNFAISGAVEYTVGVQLWAVAGTPIKVVLRRAGPTYEKLAPDQWITSAGAWQTVGFMFRAVAAVPNARLDIEVPTSRIRVNLREAHVTRSLPGGIVTGTFVDGLQIRRAHHPNFGQGVNANSPYASIASAGGKTTLDATALQLPAGGTLTSGLGVTMRTVDWAIEEREIAAVSNGRITLSTPTDYPLEAGYGFFLTGALWMLDAPGEWFYDKATGTLYAWMPDGAVPGNRVAAGGIALGVDLRSQSNLIVKDLLVRRVGTGVDMFRNTSTMLSNLVVSDSLNFGISAENCVQCTVQGSSIARTGLDGISVVGPLASRFTLQDSSVADSGASVRTDGWRMLPRPAMAGVNSIGRSSQILRNRFTGSAKLGIFAGASSIISDNYVGQSCLNLNDCGGIYAGRISSGNTISANLVENVVGNLAGVPNTLQLRTVGIYLDDDNASSVVTGNTVTGAVYGVQLHNANGATVSGNVMFGNARHQAWVHENTTLARSSGDVFGNRFDSNLFVPTASGPAVNFLSEIGETADFASFSGNRYSALLSQRVIGETSPTSGKSYTVAEWQAAGRETGALVTQPVGYASFLAGALNLVPNGNLAGGVVGWTSWNQTAPMATATVSNCGFAPCISMVAGGSPSLLTSPYFSVTAGQWYRVSFDAATSLPGQAINVVVRRGGGGTAGYEYLMPAAESLVGSTTWRRYSFTFQALKTIIVNNPITQERGARVDFERNQAGTALSVARLEMVTLSPAQAALQIRLLLNRSGTTTSVDCASLGVDPALCNSFVYFGDDTPVIWPALVGRLSGVPVYTRDTTLADTDGDGIADQQDACPGTAAGMAVNSRGCSFNQ